MPRWTGVLLAALTVVACAKPKQGASCDDGSRACAGNTLLMCENGRWAAYTCGGPAGCGGKGETCDFKTAAGNERCPPAFEGRTSCGENGKARIRCSEGKWQSQPCRGAKGCAEEQGKFLCDRGAPIAGDSCVAGQNDDACGADGRTYLRCVDGKYQQMWGCDGPNACKSTSLGAMCDTTLGTIGDGCETNNDFACSKDRTTLILCGQGKWVKSETCEGGKTCKHREGALPACL